MRHPSEGELLAYLDGELTSGRRLEVSTHLEACGECSARLEDLQTISRRLSEGLERLDAEPPTIGAETVRRQHAVRTGRRKLRRTLAKAAVLVLLAGGAAAAAIPDSPVRGWIEDSIERLARLAGVHVPVDTTGAEATAERTFGGVSVAMRDGQVRVSIRQAERDAVVRLRLVDGSEASVRAIGARYRTTPGRIEVVNPGGELVVELPRDARRAQVEVDGHTVVLKEGNDLRVLETVADSSGAEVVFRVGPER